MGQDRLKTINLALQGGGARGAFTWGVLDKLLEDGRIEFDGISATSAGSLNAVMLAQGLLNGGNEGGRSALNNFWHAIGDYGHWLNTTKITALDYLLFPYLNTPAAFTLFRTLTGLWSPYQFNPFNYNPIRKILENMLNLEQIRRHSSLELYICATNVKTGKLHIFSKDELSINSILASCCLPHLFQTVEVNGDSYWDGGFLGNPAIFPLIYNTMAKDILIIHTSPFKRNEVPMEASTIFQRMTELAFHSSLMREIRAIAFVSDMIKKNQIKEECKNQFKEVRLHCLDADHVLQDMSLMSTYNVSMDFLLKMRDLGRNTADQWLQKNYASIGKSSTIDFDEWT